MRLSERGGKENLKQTGGFFGDIITQTEVYPILKKSSFGGELVSKRGPRKKKKRKGT